MIGEEGVNKGRDSNLLLGSFVDAVKWICGSEGNGNVDGSMRIIISILKLKPNLGAVVEGVVIPNFADGEKTYLDWVKTMKPSHLEIEVGTDILNLCDALTADGNEFSAIANKYQLVEQDALIVSDSQEDSDHAY